MRDDQTSVLFICLGNICRSPLAQGIFAHLVNQRGIQDRFRIDSCGTGSWHTGNPPDPRSVLTASNHGIDITHQRARSFDPRTDPETFDWLIPMDRSNERDILDLGAPRDKVRLMLSFDPEGTTQDVPDPYYGADDGFERVYEMLVRSCGTMIDSITDRA